MYQDDIIKEVWENRKRFSEKHRHNIDSMIEELIADQNASTRKIIDRRLSPKKMPPDSQDLRH